MLYSFQALPSITRTPFVDEWQSVEKRNGDEISSALEFFSGCAPSGQIAVEDKGNGVIASFETVRRKFRLNRNEKRSPISICIVVLYRTFLARMKRKTFRNWTLRANVARLVQGWGRKRSSKRVQFSNR